jgi:hypothetical protein
VIGVGPAGAHLATLCVLARETLQRPSRDPHATARDVVLGGLGLARGACIDFATDGRTDPERLLEAALDRRVELMVWLAGPCAWIEDPTRRTAIVAGPGAAFVFDARDARRSREVVAGVRLTRLTAGGTFDFLAPRALPPRHAREKRTVQNDAQPLLRDVFGAPSAGNAWNSSKEWTLAGEGRCLRITFETASDGARDTPAIPGRDEARLDWLPRRP